MKNYDIFSEKNLQAVCIAWFAAVAIALALGLLLRVTAPRETADTDHAVRQIETVTDLNARRAEIIIDAAKAEKEKAKNEIVQKILTTSDDDLPDLLAGLLKDYRRGR